jgi:transposase InsO family protein
LFQEHKGRYGYPRITLALQHSGWVINKKKVARIMHEQSLYARKPRIKYSSYRGDIGKRANNILAQDFAAEGPYQKMGTDVSVFITPFGKLYLSPVIDFHTREVLAYDLSGNPNFEQIRRMLKSLYKKHGVHLKGSILHSDQGYQYQVGEYSKLLETYGITQSMSRKGNCLDNSPTENFFGRLKTEMYYGKEYTFTSLEDLENKIHEYILYYNEQRIVTRLKNSPVKYRQTFYLKCVGSKTSVQLLG